MTLAPSFEELQQKQNQNKTIRPNIQPEVPMEPTNQQLMHQDFSVDGVVNFKVFGAGGAGKIAALRYAQSPINKATSITTIDTSGISSEIQDVEAIRISGLNGSGKLRKDNVEAISNFVMDYSSKNQFDDVNILVMSLSGGSGSVAGPILMDQILRQKKIAIVIGIIDTDSEIDTINAFNSLKTLDNFASNRKAYVPLILFDNKAGRYTVDKGIDLVLAHLTSLLAVPYIGLDKQDRIKFLSPDAFGTIEPGLKMINVSKRSDGEWEEGVGIVIPNETHEKLDATIIISSTESNLQLMKRCTVIYRGFFEGLGENLIASIGYQIPEQFIKDLNANIHTFKSTMVKPKTEISAEYEIGKAATNNGLIL